LSQISLVTAGAVQESPLSLPSSESEEPTAAKMPATAVTALFAADDVFCFFFFMMISVGMEI
jgi:hypothetical protein